MSIHKPHKKTVNSFAVKCPHCQKWFGNGQALADHLNHVHKKDDQ